MLSRLMRIALALASVLWIFWAVTRLIDVDGLGWWIVAPQTLSLYAWVITVVALVLAGLLRRWIVAGVAAIGVVVLGALLIERLTANGQPTVKGGVTFTVMELNANQGNADPAAIVAMIRSRHVDALSLPEVTPGLLTSLDKAGLKKLLAYRQAVPAEGSGGIGAFTRAPSDFDHDLPPVRPFMQSKIVVPSAGTVRFEALHALPPRPKTAAGRFDQASRMLEQLTAPRLGGLPAIVAGDLNATLDNRGLRRLLKLGYRDAAEQTGHGIAATWSGAGGLARLTIDHVLVPPGVAVQRYELASVPGTDHRALIVTLKLPPAGD